MEVKSILSCHTMGEKQFFIPEQNLLNHSASHLDLDKSINLYNVKCSE